MDLAHKIAANLRRIMDQTVELLMHQPAARSFKGGLTGACQLASPRSNTPCAAGELSLASTASATTTESRSAGSEATVINSPPMALQQSESSFSNDSQRCAADDKPSAPSLPSLQPFRLLETPNSDVSAQYTPQNEQIALAMTVVVSMIDRELDMMAKIYSDVHLDTPLEELQTYVTMWGLQPFLDSTICDHLAALR